MIVLQRLLRLSVVTIGTQVNYVRSLFPGSNNLPYLFVVVYCCVVCRPLCLDTMDILIWRDCCDIVIIRSAYCWGFFAGSITMEKCQECKTLLMNLVMVAQVHHNLFKMSISGRQYLKTNINCRKEEIPPQTSCSLSGEIRGTGLVVYVFASNSC